MPLIKKFRFSGRDNPRFRVELSNLITERNASWAKAKSINSPVDWTVFRALRNKFTTQIRTTNSDYYIKSISDHLNKPTKFWKQINSLSRSKSNLGLPDCILVKSSENKNKDDIALNKRGSSNFNFLSTLSGRDLFMDPFVLKPVSSMEICKALKAIDPKHPKQSPKPNNLDPYLLKLAADFIAEPIAQIVYLSHQTNIIPKTIIIPETILSEIQSGFRVGHHTISAALTVTNDIINALDTK